MGNSVMTDIDNDDELIDQEIPIRPISPRSQILMRNEIIWTFAKNNAIVNFTHTDRQFKIHECLGLRHTICYPIPMKFDQYIEPTNCYCQCFVSDGNALVLMGFILYRCRNHTMYILDIVFLKETVWREKYPQFNGFNIPGTCLEYFNVFCKRVGYKCVWRPILMFGKKILFNLQLLTPGLKPKIARRTQTNRKGKSRIKITNCKN